MIRRRHLLFCSMALWCSVGVLSAQDAKVRTSVVTTGELWTGQRIVVAVELLAPGFFSGVAAFDLPRLPGMLLIPPTGSPLVSTEAIGAVSYTVQIHELSLISQRAGKQGIPSFPARFSFKRNPLDKDPVTTSVKTDPFSIEVNLPPGAENLGALISARDVSGIETWKPEPPRVVKAGDAFTREIVFSAPEVPGMAFPPFPAGRVEGLGIYPKAPEVLDANDRGVLSGKRRDAITYICERPGEFVIPAVRLTWFDLESKKLRSIEFPQRKFSVAANPAMTAAAPTSNEAGRNGFLWLGVSAIAGAVGWLGWRARHRLSQIIAPLRPTHLQPLNPSPSLANPHYQTPQTSISSHP